jgi:pimeloyl-ACP methyl ester carboxylesterase
MNTVAETAALPRNSTTDRVRPFPVPSWVRATMKVTSAISPPAAARLAQRLLFTPVRARVRDEERAVLASGERFSLAAGGQRVAGYAWGEGPTVLLVHGWGGHAGQMTTLVDPVVAAGFRAVAIDLPGHGESEGSLSSLVHCAKAIAGAAALFKPVRGLVAHSFGAAASTYAMSQGLPVGRAVFFAPPARFESFWSRFQVGAGVPEEIMRRVMRRAESWLDVRFEGLAPVDLAPGMTTPLLVLHDPQDREMPFEDGAELARHWPGAEIRPAQGHGHLRILRDEGCVGQAVEFLGVRT